jgi:hypothetical protein
MTGHLQRSHMTQFGIDICHSFWPFNSSNYQNIKMPGVQINEYRVENMVKKDAAFIPTGNSLFFSQRGVDQDNF